MNSKILFIYKFNKLFEILNEIKENLNFEIRFISDKDYNSSIFANLDNYLILSIDNCNNMNNCLEIKDIPIRLINLIEKINLAFLRNQFNNQSEFKIGKYVLDLNSRKIYYKKKGLNLTEKESDLILFINSNNKSTLREIQSKVWGYSLNLETHTVETHIYRLRKKIFECFKDRDFILHDKKGYFLK